MGSGNLSFGCWRGWQLISFTPPIPFFLRPSSASSFYVNKPLILRPFFFLFSFSSFFFFLKPPFSPYIHVSKPMVRDHHFSLLPPIYFLKPPFSSCFYVNQPMIRGHFFFLFFFTPTLFSSFVKLPFS